MIVFISFGGADNHGIGYMCALLKKEGFKTKVLDLRQGERSIIKKIRELDPVIIGFSIIFQYHFRQFIDIASFLRKEGIKCHFTAGGHYASLRYEELFRSMPWLDSIVRFEGEYTIVELTKLISSGSDWHKIDGLVYKPGKSIIKNPIRQVETDLDKFPFPLRPRLKKYAFDIKFASIIAGRGCIYNCSFCNTREYYSQMSGPMKRSRRPEMVVSEMEYLYRSKGCKIFMFDDDDFPVITKKGDDWIGQFCFNLKKTGLDKRILWKINCRPDEVDDKSFRIMRDNGLFHVFLGIEDGTEAGLRKLNKYTKVDENIKSINTLKDLGIGFDFGFMLFQPGTKFDSLKENLRFLKLICGDGYTPVTFLKLLPLYETRVEKELRETGRLKIIDGQTDYDFLEEPMNDYYKFVMNCFYDWLTGKNGMVNVAQCAINYFEVYPRFFGENAEMKIYQTRIRNIIADGNLFLINTLEELTGLFETKRYVSEVALIGTYGKKIKLYQTLILELVNHTMRQFLSIDYPKKNSILTTLES